MLAPSASKSKSSRPGSRRRRASDCIASGAWATCHRLLQRLPRCQYPPPSPASRVFAEWRSVLETNPRASAAASCSAWPTRSERSFLISSIFDLILFWLFFNCVITGSVPNQIVIAIRCMRWVSGWVVDLLFDWSLLGICVARSGCNIVSSWLVSWMCVNVECDDVGPVQE